jgi:hypothetical protein
MKVMQRDAGALDKARRAERKADEKSGLITIKPLKLEAGTSKGGFKKGGFKSAFGAPKVEEAVEKGTSGSSKLLSGDITDATTVEKVIPTPENSDEEDPGYEYYDPKKPTGCNGSCTAPTN